MHGLDRAISDRHGIDSIRQWSPTRPFRIRIAVAFEIDDGRAAYDFSIDSKNGQFSISKEDALLEHVQEVSSEDEDGKPEDYWFMARTRLLRALDGSYQITKQQVGIEPTDGPPDWRLLDKATATGSGGKLDQSDDLALFTRHAWELTRLRRACSQFQAYSIFPNTLRQPQEPSNETYLLPEGRNLASVFKRMRRTRRGVEAINQITEAMRKLLPSLERISILSVGGYLVPQFHMMERERRHIFNVSQLSDGTLRVFGLLTALYQEPKPDVIALEEPEQTINPGVLPVLADSIKEVSKRTQIFITTHSPHLLDQFDPNDVISVDIENGRTRVGKVGQVQIDAVRHRLFTLGELLISEGLHP